MMRILACTALSLLLWTQGAVAEIYTWTDAEGKVHFGDQPPESDAAPAAEPVQLQQGYQPEVRSPEESAAMQREQAAIQEANRKRKEADARARDEARQAQDKRKREYCAALASDIEKFGSTRYENGRLVIHYIEGEDGKSISAEEQRRLVEELRARWQTEGCDEAS